MARSDITSQSRFGPAQSRANVFSVFEQARVDEDAGKAAQNLADIAGAAAEYQGQKSLQDAEKELEEGIVSGLISDGTEIREGRMDPGESVYFERGVAMGRMRAAALEIGMRLNERRQMALANGERIPTDSEEYEEWREAQLAEIQQDLGIDPSGISGAVGREYAAGLMQVRQHDAQRHQAYRSEILLEDAYQSFDVELRSIWQNAESTADAVAQASQLVTNRRATGLDAARLRTMAVQSVLIEAQENTDPEIIREYIDASVQQNPPLITQAQQRSLVETMNTLENRRQSEENSNRIAAERARDEAENAALDAAAEMLSRNPHAPMPPEFHSNAELVTGFTRLQNAFISGQENRVNPASSALVVDNLLGMATRDGFSPAVREELGRALVNGVISPSDYVSGLDRLRTLEANPGVLTDAIVNMGRQEITFTGGLAGIGTQSQQELNMERRRTYDHLVLEYVSEWREAHPDSQQVPPSVLSDIAGRAQDAVLRLSPVETFGRIDPSHAARLRQEREGDNQSEEETENEPASLTIPIPGQQ